MRRFHLSPQPSLGEALEPSSPGPDKPKRRSLKLLKVGFSGAWGLVSVLLVVLWWRSYFGVYAVSCGPDYTASSYQGKLYWGGTYFVVDGTPPTQFLVQHPKLRIFVVQSSTLLPWANLDMPIWIATCAAAAASFIPWLSWRFSLRAFLLFVTILALLLGIVAM